MPSSPAPRRSHTARPLPADPLLSVVMPVYNERTTIDEIVRRVLAVPLRIELIVVDDASTDSTPELLAGYGAAIRCLRLEVNAGFATACNAGAAAARGEALVFLNNDTEPRPGWLAALRRHAAEHPAAAVVGARLLYPSGVVQHAGVVFGQDGYPHHLYAGFPADHPAVSHPRRLQAVTAACMLVERRAFERAEGFDTGFHNSLEDVDLCLRIGEAGGEIHYCPDAVLVHLESASRGRSDRFERSVTLWRQRWRQRVQRDDFEVYVSDGLIGAEYSDSYPLRLSVDPALAVVDKGREEQIERMLESYARQVSDLLQEVVRLSASPLTGNGTAAATADAPTVEPSDAEELLARASRIEADARGLQLAAEKKTGLEPGPRLGNRRLTELVREAVEEHVPPGAAVLVVSRGDRELIRFHDRRGEHFPQGGDGGYAGHYPADSDEAIVALERLREKGAQFIAVPPPSAWWLDHYDGFARHLERYPLLTSRDCGIYDLRQPVAAVPT
jgi:GT2 family glycosyltransferase